MTSGLRAAEAQGAASSVALPDDVPELDPMLPTEFDEQIAARFLVLLVAARGLPIGDVEVLDGLDARVRLSGGNGSELQVGAATLTAVAVQLALAVEQCRTRPADMVLDVANERLLRIAGLDWDNDGVYMAETVVAAPLLLELAPPSTRLHSAVLPAQWVLHGVDTVSTLGRKPSQRPE